jgi:hypothetical protein
MKCALPGTRELSLLQANFTEARALLKDLE